jgi:hypothetical protein
VAEKLGAVLLFTTVTSFQVALLDFGFLRTSLGIYTKNASPNPTVLHPKKANSAGPIYCDAKKKTPNESP